MIITTNRNELYAFGTIWGGDGMDFVSALARLEKQYTDITVKLHTYGGSVFDGNLMCNAIESSNANITIDILGLAASMGGVLIMSSKTVRIVENGFIMIHAPKGGEYGDAKDHENYAKLLRLIEDNFIKKLAKRLNKTEAEVRIYLQGDNWIGAEEAKQLGLVSEIIPSAVETILPTENLERYEELEVYNLYSHLLEQPAAFYTPPVNTSINFKNSDTMKKELIEILALVGLTEQSSDTAFVEAVKEKFNKLKGEKDTAEAELKTFKDAQINALIAGANIPTEEVEAYKKIGETSGIESLQMVLGGKQKPQAPNVGAMIQSGNAGNLARADWNFDKWQKEDPRGLEKLAVEKPEEFKKLTDAKYKK